MGKANQQKHNSSEIDKKITAFRHLQRGLTGNRELIGVGYMSDKEISDVYDLFYTPISIAQADRIFSKIKISPNSLLDMGAGTGAFSVSASRFGLKHVTMVDYCQHALEKARQVLLKAGVKNPKTLKSDLCSKMPVFEDKFDFVAFGHSLNELWKHDNDRLAKRFNLIERLLPYLEPNAVIIVAEPSTLTTGRDALQLRDLLENNGWEIIAPCTRPGPCPALLAGQEQTCRDDVEWTPPFSVRFLASKLHLDKNVLKMTWFAARKSFSEKKNAKKSDDQVYRIVSEGLLNKSGRIRYLICGPEGRFGFSAKQDDTKAKSEGFFSLARGDLVRIFNPEIRSHGWGFGSETTIHPQE